MNFFKSALSIIVILLLGTLFFACSDDENDDDKIKVKVIASLKYEKDGELLVDDKARICIFQVIEDTKSWVFDETTYKFIISNNRAYMPQYTLVMRGGEEFVEESVELDKGESYIYVYVPRIDRSKYEIHDLKIEGKTINISKVFKE